MNVKRSTPNAFSMCNLLLYHAEGKNTWWIFEIMFKNDDTKSLLPLLLFTIKWLLFFCHLREKVLMNNRGVMSTILFLVFVLVFGVAVHFFVEKFCLFILPFCSHQLLCYIVEIFHITMKKVFPLSLSLHFHRQSD